MSRRQESEPRRSSDGGGGILFIIGAVAAGLAGWLVVRRTTPVIATATLSLDGDLLILRGQGFGASRRRGRIHVMDHDADYPADVHNWADDRVVARVDGLQAGSRVMVERRDGPVRRISDPVEVMVPAPGLPSGPYGYEVPVEPESPWPSFQRDRRNTASSPLTATYNGDTPWAFKTGKGIFSSPVIGGDNTIYIGSADHYFYALTPDGRQKWRFKTGELIDSAALLMRPFDEYGLSLVVPSGDGFLYRLRADDGRMIWSFDARISPRDSYNNWFEANVSMGFDGTLYAGNTNFNYYALNRHGELKWVFETEANAWACGPVADDGTIYWTSNDTFVYAVRPDGKLKWKRRTLGFIAASPAIGPDGTVYVGSYDSYLYALDGTTGRTRWKVKTGDHIYGSTAIGFDGTVYVGSTDGIFYAVAPDGEVRWRFDTGAPIRSSSVIGRTPEDDGEIVYFGAGNGSVYALNCADGTRRWSYDTTNYDPELADRNDVNGSPALGKNGLYIGGEHGEVWYLPYDYPLHHPGDPRGSTQPSTDLPADMAGLAYVTSGGNLALTPPETIPASTIITLRLFVREGGESQEARFYTLPVGRPDDAIRVSMTPEVPLRWETSADGKYLHIFPEDFLPVGQQVTLKVEGLYYDGGLNIGNLTVGGSQRGTFSSTFTFTVEAAESDRLPLHTGEKRVTAFEWTRLSVPIPPMMPSLNQIGFDYMDWIIGAVVVEDPDANRRGRCVLWAVGGHRDKDGVLRADPDTDFTLPFSGRYQYDAFMLTNRDFSMAVTGIPIPFNVFELRGRMGADCVVTPGATAYADTQVLKIPTFGPLLVIAGLASNLWQKLLTLSTYITRPYPEDGPANIRPEGVSVAALDFEPPTEVNPGYATAYLRLADGVTYSAEDHRGGLLLLDPVAVEAVALNYHAHLSQTTDEDGNLYSITLNIPAGTALPGTCEAVVMLDVFPLHRVTLNGDPT